MERERERERALKIKDSCTPLPSPQKSISIPTHLANTVGLGGRVDGNEDDLGFLDGSRHICAEKQVLATALLDHLVKSRLRKFIETGKTNHEQRC